MFTQKLEFRIFHLRRIRSEPTVLTKRRDRYAHENSGDTLRVFEEYAKAELEISCLSDCDNYIEGFRTGAKMMMDVLLEPSVRKTAP